MVQTFSDYGTYFRCLPNEPIIGTLMRAGGTLYRNTTDHTILVVPNGATHSDAWRKINATQ